MAAVKPSLTSAAEIPTVPNQIGMENISIWKPKKGQVSLFAGRLVEYIPFNLDKLDAHKCRIVLKDKDDIRLFIVEVRMGGDISRWLVRRDRD